MRSNVKRLAVFCTLLMLWSAIAVVAHHHSTKSESVRCTVCVGAHSAAPRAISNRPSPSFVRVSVVHLASSSFSHRINSYAVFCLKKKIRGNRGTLRTDSLRAILALGRPVWVAYADRFGVQW